jgi:S1-C subfamily serine protease
MSENEKDNKDFEFIKEQVIEKKHKKLKKRLFALCMTILMAILFGLIAAVTFCLAEPRLYKLLHKEEDTKTPITFPTEYPDNSNSQGNSTDPGVTGENNNTPDNPTGEPVPTQPLVQQPDPVIKEIKIDADIDDYLKMYDEIKTVASSTGKALVTVLSIKNDEDWFSKTVNLKSDTTGLVIFKNNTDLLILVSLDRIKDADSIKIQLSDNLSVNAELLDFDSELNLAVISAHLKDIPETYRNIITTATLGESYSITVGTPIAALGSPNGQINSMEVGIVTSEGSSVSVTDNRLDLFNTSIADYPDSDGFIINMRGEVVGLITRTLKEGTNKDLNTVIGISKLKSIIERLANQNARIYFGVMTEDLTDEAMKELNVGNGIYVNEVQSNSPAFDAGIKNGDIILQVNDTLILNANNFNNTISGYQPEDKVKVKIKRTSSSPDKEMEIEVTLAKKNK